MHVELTRGRKVTYASTPRNGWKTVKTACKNAVPKNFEARRAIIRGPVTLVLVGLYSWKGGLQNRGDAPRNSRSTMISKPRILGVPKASKARFKNYSGYKGQLTSPKRWSEPRDTIDQSLGHD